MTPPSPSPSGSTAPAAQSAPNTTDARPSAPNTDALGEIDTFDRATSPYTTKEKVGRILWNMLGQPLFSLTFHNWYALRNAMLRLFGATIHSTARLRPSVRIEQPWNLTIGANSSVGDHAILYCLGKVIIGADVSISQYAHLCAGSHDYTRPDMPLLRPPITVEDQVWIAADAFVGPNLTLREGSIVGARATVLKSTAAWTIYLGNPAQPVKARPPLAPRTEPTTGATP